MLYTFLQPVQYVMNADSVNEAIKNYVKFHRFHNISQIMLKDHEKMYKANLKYFKHDGRNKVGINVYPTNPSITITSNINTDRTMPVGLTPAHFMPLSPVATRSNGATVVSGNSSVPVVTNPLSPVMTNPLSPVITNPLSPVVTNSNAAVVNSAYLPSSIFPWGN